MYNICIWKFPTVQVSILIIGRERGGAHQPTSSIYKLQLGVSAIYIASNQ